MTLQEVSKLMDPAETQCFSVWVNGGVFVGVNRSCIETTLGVFPLRRDFTSQDKFHDAYYSWVSKARELAIEMLKNFAKKNGLPVLVAVDAWDKPTLRIE
jgi:hypothetical protein